MISLFYALGLASASASVKGLGWDPTVERIQSGNEIQYKFTVRGKVFTTTRELATFGADSMVGRGTRVYEARDAEGNLVALKDSWRESDRDSEGDIVTKIMASCRDKLSEEEVAEAEQHFLVPLLWEDVAIDGATDETADPSFGGELGNAWVWRSLDLEPELSRRLHSPSVGHIPSGQSTSYHLRRTAVDGRNDLTVPKKTHAHTVFEYVGLALKDITPLADSLGCLSDGLKGKATILTVLAVVTHAALRPILYA